ncbi:MAG: hypothetical protein PVF17_13685 [Ignavibacteria bacterium]|jgi:hypothetical protein
MKKTLSGFAILSLLLLLNFCAASEVYQEFPYGNLQYRSYNFRGDLVGEGTLYISQSDSNSVTGNWNIRKVRDCNTCGTAQFGSGFLTGYIENDVMYINLNPDEIEVDTYLTGSVESGEFKGKWNWQDQVGFGYYGTFEATKFSQHSSR